MSEVTTELVEAATGMLPALADEMNPATIIENAIVRGLERAGAAPVTIERPASPLTPQDWANRTAVQSRRDDFAAVAQCLTCGSINELRIDRKPVVPRARIAAFCQNCHRGSLMRQEPREHLLLSVEGEVLAQPKSIAAPDRKILSVELVCEECRSPKSIELNAQEARARAVPYPCDCVAPEQRTRHRVFEFTNQRYSA